MLRDSARACDARLLYVLTLQDVLHGADSVRRDAMSPEARTQPSHAMIHVARQAILDARGLVNGYELRYRGVLRDAAESVDADVAGARLLAGAVLDLRIDTLTDGHTAFINITRSMLVNGAATLLRPNVAVFEIGADIGVDPEVIAACRSLRSGGYRLVLDDFTPGSPAGRLLPYVAFVKVDVRAMSADTLADIAKRMGARRVTLVAAHVDTRVAFETARDAGCGLFQGHYFRRPETRSGAGLPWQHAAYVRLLSALNRPALSIDELETLVKQHAILAVRILQCINSAAYAVQREVHSIREAIVFLGTGIIKKWASVWCLSKLTIGVGSELTRLSLIRARSCELLAEGLTGIDPDELFLVGLCSVLDAILDRPMADAIAGLPLTDEAKAALLGQPGPMRAILDAVIAYEDGAWEDAVDAVESLGATESRLPLAQRGALMWAQELSASHIAS